MAIERLHTPGDSEWRMGSADHLARYQFASDYTKGNKSVLDVGTGIGYGAAILACTGAKHVTGLDIDAATIETAKIKYNLDNIHYICGNAETLNEAEGLFDVICSFENIEHLQHPELFVYSASAKLNRNGVMICSTPDRRITPPFLDGKPANPYHINEWYKEDFLKLLHQSFESVKLFAQVKSYALTCREVAAESVAVAAESYASVLREPPFRAISKLGSLIGVTRKSRIYPTLDIDTFQLAAPTVSDYPIVPEPLTDLYGTFWCHVAVCQNNTRTNSQQ